MYPRLIITLILGLWSELALHDQLVEGDALLQGRQVHDGDQEVAGLEEGRQPVGLGWAVDLKLDSFGHLAKTNHHQVSGSS